MSGAGEYTRGDHQCFLFCFKREVISDQTVDCVCSGVDGSACPEEPADFDPIEMDMNCIFIDLKCSSI